jgi:hypothetical protein
MSKTSVPIDDVSEMRPHQGRTASAIYVSADFRTGVGLLYEGYDVRITDEDRREALSGVSDSRSETPLCELKRDARVMTKSGC